MSPGSCAKGRFPRATWACDNHNVGPSTPMKIATARLARAHNNANILALGQRIVGSEVARDLVRAWLETPFDGGRHERRLKKLAAVEGKMSATRERGIPHPGAAGSGRTAGPRKGRRRP